MRVDVMGTPDGDNEAEQYSFVFLPETMTLRFVHFQRYTRDGELEDWQPGSFWAYPDLFHKADLDRPQVPLWAMLQARALLCQQLSFDN